MYLITLYKLLILVVFGPAVKDLGSDDYRTREAAEARLSSWASFCCPLLDKDFKDIEQRRRARRILEGIIPDNPPPIGLLSGKPLLEWCKPVCAYGSIGSRPSLEYMLTWARPDTTARFFLIVHYYGERARTQWLWKDWQLDSDGRQATRLLCRDMRLIGIPPSGIRLLLDYLRHREEAMSIYPSEKIGMGRVRR